MRRSWQAVFRRGSHRFPWLFVTGVALLVFLLARPHEYQPITWTAYVVSIRENGWLISVPAAVLACARVKPLRSGVLGAAPDVRRSAQMVLVLAGQAGIAAALGIVAGSLPVLVLLTRTASDEAAVLVGLLPSVLSLFGAVLMGALCGLVVPGPAAQVITTICVVGGTFIPYLLSNAAISGGRSFLSLSARWGNRFPELGWELVTATVIAQSALFILAGGALLVLAIRQVQSWGARNWDRISGLAVLPVAVCAMGLVVVQPDLARPEEPVDVLCLESEDSEVSVCGHADREPVLADILAEARAVARYVNPPQSARPVLVRMDGLHPPGDHRLGLEIYVFPHDDEQFYRLEVRREIAAQMLGFPHCVERMPPAGSMAPIPEDVLSSFDLHRALSDDVAARSVGSADRGLPDLSDEELTSAIAQNWQDIQECRLPQHVFTKDGSMVDGP